MSEKIFKLEITNKHSWTSGSVLLFALLIMSSVVIGSIGIGTLIFDLLQQTRITDSSTLAFYAAESGIEQSLFNARRTGKIPDSYGELEANNLANITKWWGSATGTTEIIYTEINENDFIEVDLYDPDAPAIATNIDHVEVIWSDSCVGCSVLRASVASWLPGAQITWTEDTARFDHPFEFIGGFAELSLGPPTKLYKLRLRAKNNTLENVVIRAHDSLENVQSIPGRLTIDLIGQHLDVRRRLIATLPRSAPLSGIFDFVIFSECSLVKGGRPISCP
jgi:hypothetical protein